MHAPLREGVERSVRFDKAAGRQADEGQRFARRMYLLRIVGPGLGAVCIGGGLWQQAAPGWVWALMLANAFLWPHLAYALARRSRDTYKAELRNLVVDSACGGAWVAAMGFNIVPSAVVVSMLAMDKAAVGGMRLLVRCLAAQATAAAVVALATGVALHPQSELIAVVASLPLLVLYPVLIGLTTYRLARRVRGDNRLLAALSTLDGLTEVLNRASWERAAESEFQRCRRIGHGAAVLMLDLDHFKSINDRHGHAVGDEVLRAVAAVLRGSLRVHDLAGRYGGEEFGVLLPGANAAGAGAIAERLRKRIEALALEPRRSVRVTASIGYAELTASDANHVAWIDRADQALYRAKAEGRNRSLPALPAY
jgi:diguanylate cyclase